MAWGGLHRFRPFILPALTSGDWRRVQLSRSELFYVSAFGRLLNALILD